MKIVEISEDSTLTLIIHKDEQSVEVNVEIYKIMPKGIVLKPILSDGKALNLENSGARLELVYEREDAKPIIWRHISYGVIKIGGYPYTVLSDKTDGAEYNRRTTFRLDMDVQGTLNRNERVVVHDISSTGISFYTSQEDRKEIGSKVLISFIGGYEEITVTGEVVRQQESNGRVLHGCVINSTIAIDKFLSEEQMRRVRKSRGW